MSFFICPREFSLVGLTLNHKQMELLEMSVVANVATISSEGMPQVTPVWIVFHDGKIFFSTRVGKTKWENLLINNNVGLSIVHPKGSIFVSMIGKAKILSRDDYDLFNDVLERIIRKYVHDFDKATELLHRLHHDEDRLLVEITPSTMTDDP